jgi:predicted  nucleic acid-binding Zn-ribbon protein
MARDREPPKGVQRILNDIRSLNSSVLLISQKMKYVVRNEKILGRNLIVLNKKIKGIEDKIATGTLGRGGGNSADSDTAQALLNELEETNKRLARMEVEIDDLKQSMATKETVQEMKYVVDTINPLEYATLEQVRDMVDKKKKR